MTTETYPHIETTQDDVPMIAGTNTKVVEVVLDRMAHHWDVDEIQRQHPHLKPAQTYAALAYYHDHQDDDFLALGHQWQDSGRGFAGIVYAHQLGITIGQAIRDLELIAKIMAAEEMTNRIEFLPIR